MFKFKETKSGPVTLELSRQMKDLKPSPTERPLDKKRVRRLHAKMDEGVGISFIWIKAAVKETNETYRMNGQHSSTMLCERENNFPSGLTAHVDIYECDTMDDLALLFRQIDDRFSSRSPSDIAGAYQGVEPALTNVPPRAGKLAADGILYYQKAIEKSVKRLGDDRYSLFSVEDYHPFILWYGDIYDKEQKEFHAPHVVAAMYHTFAEDADATKQFWRGVENPPEFDTEEPAAQLAQCLQDSLNQEKDTDLKPRQYYNGCLYAWRAFRDNKKISEIRFDARKRSTRRRGGKSDAPQLV